MKHKPNGAVDHDHYVVGTTVYCSYEQRTKQKCDAAERRREELESK